jgi:hypothetical protein
MILLIWSNCSTIVNLMYADLSLSNACLDFKVEKSNIMPDLNKMPSKLLERLPIHHQLLR